MIKPYPTEAKLCCPRCAGLGYLIVTANDLRLKRNMTEKTLRCRALRNKIREIGRDKVRKMSLRETGKLLGIKSPQRVKHHLIMLENIGWDRYE